MNTLTKTLILPIVFGLVCGCRATDTLHHAAANESRPAGKGRTHGNHKPRLAKTPNSNSVAEAATSSSPPFTRPLYTLDAGGAVVGLTNAPSSNPVHITFVRWGDRSGVFHNQIKGAFFRLTNGERHSILLWNVRVQIRTSGSAEPLSGSGTVRNTGAAAFHAGWTTASDNYPAGPGSSHFAPGSSDEFWVELPTEAPWRVCILYSVDWQDKGNTYGGNYEVIGEEMKE